MKLGCAASARSAMCSSRSRLVRPLGRRARSRRRLFIPACRPSRTQGPGASDTLSKCARSVSPACLLCIEHDAQRPHPPPLDRFQPRHNARCAAIVRSSRALPRRPQPRRLTPGRLLEGRGRTRGMRRPHRAGHARIVLAGSRRAGENGCGLLPVPEAGAHLGMWRARAWKGRAQAAVTPKERRLRHRSLTKSNDGDRAARRAHAWYQQRLCDTRRREPFTYGQRASGSRRPYLYLACGQGALTRAKGVAGALLTSPRADGIRLDCSSLRAPRLRDHRPPSRASS